MGTGRALAPFLIVALLAISGVVAFADEPAGIIFPPPCFILDDDFEDNDSLAEATRLGIAAPGPYLQFSTSVRVCTGDDDFFAFPVSAGGEIQIDLTFLHSSGDIDMGLRDPDGLVIVASSTNTDNEKIRHFPAKSGLYVLRVGLDSDPSGSGNPYDMKITVTCPPPGAVFSGTGAFYFEESITTPLAFPDVDPLGMPNCFTIAEHGDIKDLDVSVHIKHPHVTEIWVRLTHFDTGTSVLLVQSPGAPGTQSTGGCEEADILALFSDSAPSAAEDACASPPPALFGALRPNGPLSAFNGEDIAGTWVLQPEDRRGSGSDPTGTLNAWSMDAGYNQPPEPTPTVTATSPPGTSTPTSPPPTSTATPPGPGPTATNTSPPQQPTATVTPPGPTATPPCGLTGDVNGDGFVNAIDAALILQFVAGLLSALPCPGNADVNADGSVNAIDAALILQFVAGLVPAL